MSDYKLFRITESGGKLMLQAADILLVQTDDVDRRNKLVTLRNGDQHLVMNYTLEEFIQFSPALIRINKSELISPDAICKMGYDFIVPKDSIKNGTKEQLTLSRAYKKTFLQKIMGY